MLKLAHNLLKNCVRLWGARSELAGMLAIARCWRFIRVGHGIATSVHDMVHASKAEMAATITRLRAALRDLESEIPAGTGKARKSLEQVFEALQTLTGQAHV